MEQSFNRILRVSGAIIMLISALIIWRGVTKMIPITGIVHGGFFVMGGVLFFALGVLMVLFPTLSARRQAKKAAAAEKKTQE